MQIRLILWPQTRIILTYIHDYKSFPQMTKKWFFWNIAHYSSVHNIHWCALHTQHLISYEHIVYNISVPSEVISAQAIVISISKQANKPIKWTTQKSHKQTHQSKLIAWNKYCYEFVCEQFKFGFFSMNWSGLEWSGLRVELWRLIEKNYNVIKKNEFYAPIRSIVGLMYRNQKHLNFQ